MASSVNSSKSDGSDYLIVGVSHISPIDVTRLNSKKSLIQELEKCQDSNNMLRRQVNDLHAQLRRKERDTVKAEEKVIKMREKIIKLQASIKTLENNEKKLKAKLADKESIKKLKEESRKTERAEKELRDLKHKLEEKDKIIAEQELEGNKVKKRLKEADEAKINYNVMNEALEEMKDRDVQREYREIEREKAMKAELNEMKSEIHEMTNALNNMHLMMKKLVSEKQTTDEKTENQIAGPQSETELQETREPSLAKRRDTDVFCESPKLERKGLRTSGELKFPQLSRKPMPASPDKKQPWKYTGVQKKLN